MAAAVNTEYALALAIPGRDDIYLRLIRQSDAEELYPILDANREFLQTHQTWVKDITPESFAKNVAENLEKTAKGEWLQYRIVERQDDAIVGTISFYDHNSGERTVKLGYWLIESAQGKGYASDAAKTATAYAFDLWDLREIIMQIEPGNERSEHVAEKLGASATGILEEEEWYGRMLKSQIWKMERPNA